MSLDKNGKILLTILQPSSTWIYQRKWALIGSLKPITVLVGALEHEFDFSRIYGNVIIPTDEVIFFRGVCIPPTR